MEKFVVTFGFNQRLAKKFAEFEAENFDKARSKVSRTYGSMWAFIYRSRKEAGVDRWGLTEVPFGEKNKYL